MPSPLKPTIKFLSEKYGVSKERIKRLMEEHAPGKKLKDYNWREMRVLKWAIVSGESMLGKTVDTIKSAEEIQRSMITMALKKIHKSSRLESAFEGIPHEARQLIMKIAGDLESAQKKQETEERPFKLPDFLINTTMGKKIQEQQENTE
jgi:hypothetical protein